MSDYRVFQYQNYRDLQNSSLNYYVDKYDAEQNAGSFEVIKAALEKVGVNIVLQPVSTDRTKQYRFSLSINPDSYLESNMRFAGPKKKGFRFPDNEHGLAGDYIYYSDIVLMLQSMSDTEIMDALGIKYATYYRHKKEMMASLYYEKLDKNKLSDISYLKNEELSYDDSWF